MKTRTLQTTILIAFAWVAVTFSAHAQALGPVQDSPDGPWYMPGEILIKFKEGATDAQLQDVVRRAGIASAKHIQTKAMKAHGDNGITRADTDRPIAQALQALQNHPAVEYAQPNWVYTHQTDANDTYFANGLLWGMYGASSSPANQYGSGAAVAWVGGNAGSKDVYVGIIDEGIQFDHPDLKANMWVNLGEIAGDGKDNDGDGYIDDIYGWNALNDNGNIYDAAYDDHGTHVAGTIGAVGGNAAGVVGVNWSVNLISGKFLGPSGGSTLDAVQAIDYMTTLKTTKGLNIVALNNSWGGGGFDQALLNSISRAAQAQILFVAAAGNGDSRGRAINTDSTPFYPAGYDTTAGVTYNSVISVTAIDSSGAKPAWANYGLKTVDLGAPGVGIYSTLPGGNYGSYDGTSMATPHVTGAIALYAAQYPGAKAIDIKNALLASTTLTPSLSSTVTKGRLDIVKFLNAPPPGWSQPDPTLPPAAPSGLITTPTSYSQIKLAWTDGSNNETKFTITRRDSAQATTTITLPANVTAYTDTGLTGETAYTYSVQACNNSSQGCSASSAAPTVTTPAAPAAATASPARVDTTTKGNWIGNYGGEGYDIALYSKAPSYGTVTFAGYTPHTWASSTTDLRALQNPNGISRFAACYYSFSNFTIDLNFSDPNPHRVSLYCVDFDSANTRQQTMRIFDRNYGTEIPGTAQSLRSFNGGQYVTWDIAGPVVIQITDDDPLDMTDNAVVSGIFFDATPITPPTKPNAPSSLTATAISRSQINLAWADNSTDETGFEIERSTSAAAGFSWIATVSPGVKTFSNTGLTANTIYYYRVRATRAPSVYSDYSNIKSTTTPRK